MACLANNLVTHDKMFCLLIWVLFFWVAHSTIINNTYTVYNFELFEVAKRQNNCSKKFFFVGNTNKDDMKSDMII